MDGTLFWNASLEELKNGFTLQGENYTCLLCGKVFEQGVIYNEGGKLLDAHKAVQTHIKESHGNPFTHYLKLGKIYTGLSAGQEEIARLSYDGLSDKEIVKATGANSASTVRNQRFAMREKYKQAKILTALFELLEEKKRQRKQEPQAAEELVDFHPTAIMVDERFSITQAERDEVLARYFGADGQLRIKDFPAKEKKKIIIMQKLMENFTANTKYSEKEINGIIKRFYEDFVTLRRYLIQYGFLDRDEEGKTYWIKN